MRTHQQNQTTAFLAFAAIALAGASPASPDPEQALLGRTKAVVERQEVSSSKTPVSGAEALLGTIAPTGARSSAKSGIAVSASYALIGR
jgi:hypothetical protein